MYRQSEKNLLNSNIFSTYPHSELRPTNGWHRLARLGHASKFQRVSHLRFVTAPTRLNGGQPNFARCLAVSWAGTLYIHFSGLLSPKGILPGAKFTLRCVEVLPSYIGTRAVDVSQTLRRGTRNGIKELSPRALPIAYSARRPSRWAWHRPTL